MVSIWGIVFCACTVVAQNNYPLNYACMTDSSIIVENPDPTLWYSMSAYSLDYFVHCKTTDIVGLFGQKDGFLISNCTGYISKNNSIIVSLSSRSDENATGDGLVAGISNENYVIFCKDLDIEGERYVAEMLLTIVEPRPTDPTYIVSSLPPVDVSFNITTSLWDESYNTPVSSASIGTRLQWHIMGPDEFDLLPVTCVAYGGTTIGGSTRKLLTMEGCSADSTLISHFIPIPLTNDRSHLYSSLYAFKFVTHDYITLACTVRICEEGSSSCTKVCSNRRRRRARHFSKRDLRNLRQMARKMGKEPAMAFTKDPRPSRNGDRRGYVIKSLRITELESTATQTGGLLAVTSLFAVLTVFLNNIQAL